MTADTWAPRRLGATTLADGRQLAWAEWGPEDGTPVLLCPGAATSRSLGFGIADLDELGVRLVSVDRPGLGASTASPTRTLSDFAADIAELADRRGWWAPGVVGYSQGAPFALACASAGLAAAVALVAAADEVARPETARLMPQEMRELAELSVTRSQEAEALFARFTPEAMRDLVMRHSPQCDLVVYQEPRFSAAYSQALQEAFVQGPGGYARDTLLAMRPWDCDLAGITAPVDLWYGSEDRSHSPDQGEQLASRIPRAVRHLVPGTGGSVLWTHARPILRQLLGGLSQDGRA